MLLWEPSTKACGPLRATVFHSHGDLRFIWPAGEVSPNETGWALYVRAKQEKRGAGAAVGTS